MWLETNLVIEVLEALLEQCKHQTSVSTPEMISISERNFMHILNISPKDNMVYQSIWEISNRIHLG